MSVSYAVDFLSLILLGPGTNDDRRRDECVEPVHVPDNDEKSAVSHAVQHGKPRHQRAGGRRGVPRARRPGGPHVDAARGDGKAAARRGRRVFHLQHDTDRHGDRVFDAPEPAEGLEREFPVERAELLRRRRCGRGRFDRHRRHDELLDRAAGRTSAVPDVSQLQDLPGPHRRRAAPRAGSLRPAPCHDRSARARDRREGSHGQVAHPPRAGVCRGPRESDRDVGERDPGRQDRRAAARHRQAGRARAHTVEAGAAHAGRVPENPHPPAGRRRDHRGRAVPLSRRAAHPEPPRALGRQGLPCRHEGRRDSGRRAHSRGRRLLRRAHVGAAVSQGDERRRRRRAASSGSRQGARSESRA